MLLPRWRFALFSQPLLQTASFSRLQVEAVFLDVFADSFSFHFATKTTQGFFEGFVVAHSDKNHVSTPTKAFLHA